jgi:N utilization substance protein B
VTEEHSNNAPETPETPEARAEASAESTATSQRVPKLRRHGARYRARRRAADIMYEAENRDMDPVDIVEDRIKLAREDEHGVAPIADYTKVLVTGVAEELDTIDSTIERYLAEDWELYRIPAVDRAIMRVAVWELLYNSDEIDLATAVSEGVELASEYSTDAAAPYINAVLDDVAHSRSEDNPMNVEAEAEELAEADEPADADELDPIDSGFEETPEEPEEPAVSEEPREADSENSVAPEGSEEPGESEVPETPETPETPGTPQAGTESNSQQ